MAGNLHLIKLCVGVDRLEDLALYQAAMRPTNAEKGLGFTNYHVTRMWPKRADELLDGGSLYWVIKGAVQARQPIKSLSERIGNDGIRRCAVELAPDLIRTTNAPRRPFQGWRYLKADDAPRDIGPFTPGEDDLPTELASALSQFGVL